MSIISLGIYEAVMASISLIILGGVIQAAIDWVLMRELARVIREDLDKDLKEEEI